MESKTIIIICVVILILLIIGLIIFAVIYSSNHAVKVDPDGDTVSETITPYPDGSSYTYANYSNYLSTKVDLNTKLSNDEFRTLGVISRYYTDSGEGLSIIVNQKQSGVLDASTSYKNIGRYYLSTSGILTLYLDSFILSKDKISSPITMEEYGDLYIISQFVTYGKFIIENYLKILEYDQLSIYARGFSCGIGMTIYNESTKSVKNILLEGIPGMFNDPNNILPTADEVIAIGNQSVTRTRMVNNIRDPILNILIKTEGDVQFDYLKSSTTFVKSDVTGWDNHDIMAYFGY